MNYRRLYNLHKVHGTKLPEEITWFIKHCSTLIFKIDDAGNFIFYDNDIVVMYQKNTTDIFNVRYDKIWNCFHRYGILDINIQKIVKNIIEEFFKIKIGQPLFYRVTDPLEKSFFADPI